MKRFALIITLLCVSAMSAWGKSTYRIVLQIDGNSDSVLYMGYYYAQGTYVYDTAVGNGKGRFVFEGDKVLHPGLYFFTDRAGRYVEFVVYHEKPRFEFHTDERDWMRNMSVKHSAENDLFYNYHRRNESIYDAIQEAERNMDSAAFVDYRRQMHRKLDTVKFDIINGHPQSMVAQMINSTREVEVPVVDAKGDTLSQRDRYDWFMHHYFDYMPIDDDFFIRTPKMLFYQHVMDYVDKYMRGMPPDLICPLLDSMIDRSEKAPEIHKWLLHNITEKYLQSNVMVYDEVYVHLVQRYFATGKATGYPPSVIDEQVERATKWERLLVGRVAPELILFDTLHRPHSLHHMPGRYTLLVFWSPTCGHCREIIPSVYNVFNEVADSLDMTAFAILTEPDETTVTKWTHFINEHGLTSPRWLHLNGGEANVDWREVYDITTTPQIFLIDNKDHTFVAKKLNADILRQLCNDLD